MSNADADTAGEADIKYDMMLIIMILMIMLHPNRYNQTCGGDDN